MVLFNSLFNKMSFLDNIHLIIKLLPDNRPKHIREDIEPKCQVLYYPIEYPINVYNPKSESLLHIVWPHRWEFDKGPELFFEALLSLKDGSLKFTVSVLGESFQDVPEVFSSARETFKDEIVHFGFIKDKQDYYEILSRAHVVVSTSKHEFFGVSV